MVDPLAVAAYAQQWNLSLQKSFAGNWLVDAGYVGTRGVKLLLNTDPNQPVPGPGAIPNRRPLFAVAPDVTTSMAQSFGSSNYHSFQLKVEKRLSHGVYLVSSYTLSKTIDDGLGNFGNGVPGVGSMGTAQDSLNRRAERARADTDQLQRLVLSYGWDLPFGTGRRFLNHGPVRWIAGGWQLAGITTLAFGNPFDMLFNPSTLNTGGAQRPDRIADGRLDTWTIDRYFDVSAFRAPAAFVYGNSGRNILRGPGVHTWDLSALKDTRIRERYNLQYRADFFNAFNRPQFNAPGNTIGTPQAGLVSSTRFSTNRQIQFVLKLFF
jgi:hypothetical protein